MLVIDRVELVLLDQLQQVGEFHRDHATRLEQDLHSRNKVIDVGHVRKDVVSKQQVGLAKSLRHLPRRGNSKELDCRTNSLLLRDQRHVCRRLDPEHGNAGSDEMLQQISVVARNLDDQAARVETESLPHLLGVASRMLTQLSEYEER